MNTSLVVPKTSFNDFSEIQLEVIDSKTNLLVQKPDEGSDEFYDFDEKPSCFARIFSCFSKRITLNSIIGKDRIESLSKKGMFKTLKAIDIALKSQSLPFYQGKQDEIDTFAITSDYQIYISSQKIKELTRNLTDTIHLNTLGMFVKVVIKDKQQLDISDRALTLNTQFYHQNPHHIKRPSALEDRMIVETKKGLNKVVIFDKYYPNGLTIPHNNVFQIAHYILGYTKGIDTIHFSNYSHCNGSLENVCYSGNVNSNKPIQSFISGFEFCDRLGSLINIKNLSHTPPETFIEHKTKAPSFNQTLFVSFDLYQIGLITLQLLKPSLREFVKPFAQLSIEERKEFFKNLKQEISGSKYLSKDKTLGLNLVKLAERLTSSAKDRKFCRQAIEELESMLKKYDEN